MSARPRPHAVGHAAAAVLELTWPGKYEADGSRARAVRTVEPLPVIERFPGPAGGFTNRLVAGDNLRALPALLAEFAGRVDLVYLDPPFGTGDAFHLRTGSTRRRPRATRRGRARPAGRVAGRRRTRIGSPAGSAASSRCSRRGWS